MSEKLRECPFCGTSAILDGTGGLWIIACSNNECAIDTYARDTAEEAITAWNTRATGWRPIEDAPKDGNDTLGWGRYHADMKPRAVVVNFDAGLSLWLDDCGDAFAPTHFMLITPPPQKETSDDR